MPVILTDEESLEEEIDDELAEDHLGELNSEDYYETYRYSEDGSINDISDQSRLGGAVSRGLRPPPQVISAQSLPNLLMADQTDGISSIEESSSGDMCTNSENNLENWIRKESLINTLSTADSKTSTLVESTLVCLQWIHVHVSICKSTGGTFYTCPLSNTIYMYYIHLYMYGC